MAVSILNYQSSCCSFLFLSGIITAIALMTALYSTVYEQSDAIISIYTIQII